MDTLGPTELSQAFLLLKNYREALAKDVALISLLKSLIKLHTKTQKAFKVAGVFEYCKVCGQGPKKGCCLREAGDWYDRYQLLINLMLGANITLNKEPESCPFLGTRGCTLLYRNEFCINFFCEDIKKALGFAKIRELRSVAGREIFEGINIEGYIRQKLNELAQEKQAI